MTPGIHHNLPAAEYHAAHGFSASILKKFHRVTDAHARVALCEPFEATPATILGALAHAAILEPDKPLPGIAFQPTHYPGDKGEMKPWHNGSNYCKEWRRVAKDSGLLIQSPEEGAKLKGVISAIKDGTDAPAIHARELLSDGKGEVSIMLPPLDMLHGQQARCRIDWVPKGRDLADLKVFREVSTWGFTRDAYDRGLHVQAWLYLAIWNTADSLFNAGKDQRDGFKFIAVENDPPHAVQVFRCSPEFLAAGERDAKAYIERWARCTETGVWAGYASREVELGLPRYAGEGCE